MSLESRLDDLERKWLPSDDDLLLGALYDAAKGDDAAARPRLKRLLAAYNPRDGHLDELAQIYLGGPERPNE